MDAKKFITGTVVGAVTFFILGYVFYVLLLGGFFESNAGPGASAMREAPLMAYMFASELIFAAFVVWVLGHVGAASFGDGAKAGAKIGLLVGFAVSLGLYGLTTLSNMTATVVDPFITAIRTAIAGGVIAAVTNRGGGSADSGMGM